MFVGRFDRRPDLDLVTINAGSDDLTFISGVFTAHPTTQTYSSGGLMPDAAIAIDPNHNGVMDLVIANSGDGHVALLQSVNEGMQLAGVIIQANLPSPTGLAPLTWSSDGIDLFAASAGQDAAQLLHFDLGPASTFLSPLGVSGADDGKTDELIAGLMPFGNSDLSLIAVFWVGSPEEAILGEWGLREPSTITALYAPTEGQGSDELTTPGSEVASNPASPSLLAPGDSSKADSSVWVRFVLGLDMALTQSRGIVEAVAARDARDIGDDRPIGELARLDRDPVVDRSISLDFEGSSATIDEALRLYWSDGRAKEEESRPSEDAPRSDPIRVLEGIDAPALEGHLETVPLVSSAVLLSTRLILKASPPRPDVGFPKARQPSRILYPRGCQANPRSAPPQLLNQGIAVGWAPPTGSGA